MLKLHGFCYSKGHPLSNLSPLEEENVELLKANFVTVDETQYNILPLLEAFDIVRRNSAYN